MGNLAGAAAIVALGAVGWGVGIGVVRTSRSAGGPSRDNSRTVESLGNTLAVHETRNICEPAPMSSLIARPPTRCWNGIAEPVPESSTDAGEQSTNEKE